MSSNVESLWAQCKEFIYNNVDRDDFRKLFLDMCIVRFDDNVLTFSVPDNFLKNEIEAVHKDVMDEAIRRSFGEDTRWGFYVTGRTAVSAETKSYEPEVTTSRNQNYLDPQLREDFDFASFVPGSANMTALTMARSIVEKPYQATFNPFFLYGPSGVGKTHLVNAIGLAIKERDPMKRVLYVTANLFKQQYTTAANKEVNKVNDFIAFYQSIDVLIIDDAQELTTKKTQQTFFHIFDHLHRNKRQLILAFDRPPAELEGFEDRLITRFMWGVVIEMERPDINLRRDILMSKLKRNGIKNFPDQVVEYIATYVDDNVRNLEGVVDSLFAYSIARNCDIDISLAETVVGRTINLRKKEISPENVIDAVCRVLSLRPADIHSKKRKQDITRGRQIAMYLCQSHTKLGIVQIGRSIGKRDHSTVMHSCKVVKQMIDTNKEFRELVESIEKEMFAFKS